jgi:polysaccharide export outer membrane protein
MSRRSFARIGAALAGSALVIPLAAVASGRQEKPAPPPRGVEKDQHGRGNKPPEVVRDAPIEEVERVRDHVTEQIEKWLESYDLKTHPLASIPDNPPPHEGAMIDLPLVVEPPDLVLIEVLEALPGRPISGERLVRPDGTISLGFYGVVHVRGLTLPQLKVALIKHLRRYIDDDTLGLRSEPLPPDEAAEGHPLPPIEEGVAPAGKKDDPAPARPVQPQEVRTRFVSPADSTRVFVDMTAYNSTSYYVLGDVLVPGKLACTGKETVLDAIQYGGGLLPTAEPKDIRLVRPGLNGKPSKVYRVELEAIQEKGDVRTNYQIFPGDRVIVGRNEVVTKTIELDRLHAAIQPVVSSMQQNVNMLKSLGALSPERSDEVLKDLVDFWAKEVSRRGQLKLDEATLREFLLRQLKKAPATTQPGPGPGAR